MEWWGDGYWESMCYGEYCEWCNNYESQNCTSEINNICFLKTIMNST